MFYPRLDEPVWPDWLPIVDERGFMLTMVPKYHPLYRQFYMEIGCKMNRNSFSVPVYMMPEITAAYTAWIEDAEHIISYIEYRFSINSPTMHTRRENEAFPLVVKILNFTENFFVAMPELPDLRVR